MNTREIAPHGLEGRSRSDFWPRSRFYQGQYGRMLRELPPLGPWSDTELKAYLESLGKAESVGDGPTMPAGYTYFGQFIAHDITFNPISTLTRQRDPTSILSFRTPALDLDSLYGRGPKDSAYFYDRTDDAPTGRLSIGWGTGFGEDDLPRSDSETAVALIGDPRNDENTMVSQLHLAFIKLHNRFLDQFGDFAQAQTETIWHYQWVILHDYLPRLCLDKVLNRIWGKSESEPTLKWFKWKNSPFIPLEFSGAALRFGHSMVRNAYALNYINPVPIPLFGSTSLGNLRGFRRLPLTWSVQWDNFLRFEDAGARPVPQASMPIDLDLSASLMNLPKEALTPNPQEPVETNLRKRNIARGFQLDLPSGQAVARAIGAEEVLPPPLDGYEDPLWIYVLREAQAHQHGSRLGEVGSTIVAETLSGLIAGDPLSYLNVNRKWTPSLASNGDLQLRDLIRAAGMPIVADDLRRLPAFIGSKQDPRVKCMAEAEEVRKALEEMKRAEAGTDPAGQ